MSIQFTQSCPTCGRRIQIQASLMGHSIACPHCRAEFASNGVQADGRSKANHLVDVDSTDPLMARVEKALARVKNDRAIIG